MPFIRLVTQAVSHQRLEVRHVDLSTSVPLSLPSCGVGVPSQHLGVQLGAARPHWQGLLSRFPPRSRAPVGECRRWGSGPPRCPSPLP